MCYYCDSYVENETFDNLRFCSLSCVNSYKKIHSEQWKRRIKEIDNQLIPKLVSERERLMHNLGYQSHKYPWN